MYRSYITVRGQSCNLRAFEEVNSRKSFSSAVSHLQDGMSSGSTMTATIAIRTVAPPSIRKRMRQDSSEAVINETAYAMMPFKNPLSYVNYV